MSVAISKKSLPVLVPYFFEDNTEDVIIYFVSSNICNEMEQDMFYKYYSNLNKKINKVILVASCEAVHHSFWLHLTYIITTKCEIKKDNILFLDCGLDEPTIYNHGYLPYFLTIEDQGFSAQYLFTKKTKLFTALARSVRLYKLLFIQELLKRNLYNDNSIISCGVNVQDEDKKMYEELDNRYKGMFPILVDSTIDNQKSHLIWMNFTYNHEYFSECLLNVVIESSYTNDPYITKNGVIKSLTNHSTRLFLTEKTTKAFFWKQIPIFLAPPGYVKKIRDMGFDVFDDVINHSYDEVLDGYKRMVLVTNEVERLSKQGLHSILDSTLNLHNRLFYNQNHINTAKNSVNVKLNNILSNFIKQ